MQKNNNDEQTINVIAICGSLREVSYTQMALEVVLSGAKELGANVKLACLRDYDLAFCDGGDSYPPGVAQLRREVKQAKGIILGTPSYHGGFSGVLKNALDLMSFEQFEGKIIGLVGVAGGRTGAIPALDSLRTIGRALHSWVIPEDVSIPSVSSVFDKSGNINDENIKQRLQDVGRQVTRFSYLHHSRQSQEFLKLWESAADNPGADY